MFNRPQQMDWLRKDVSLLGDGKDVIVMQHYPPDAGTISVLTQCRAKAIITGHWHSNKVTVCDGITYVNAPPLRFSGIDLSPRGFKTITVANHKLSATDHYSGCRKHLAIVIPANGTTIAGRKLNIRADAYDTVSRVVRAQFSLDGSSWTKMNKSGSWGWEAGVATLKPGPHRVKVKVVLESGEALTKTASFTASGAKPAAVKPGRDWPMFKYGPDRTSATADVVKAPLMLAWSRCLGGTISLSSPVTAHGLVYVGVADNELSGKSGVYALDARTGAIKWICRTGTAIKHTVALYGQTVYAVELGGTVQALDAETGAVIWRYNLGSSADRWVYSSPLVKDGVVYVGTVSNFVALDAATGAKLWQSKLMGTDWLSSLSSPATGGSAIYLGFNWVAAAFALESTSGNKLWSRKGTWAQSTPALCGGVLYLCADKALCALDGKSGKEIWTFAMPMPLSSPAVIGSKLIVGASDGRLHAVNTRTGKEQWSFQTGKPIMTFEPYSRDGNTIISSPAVSGSSVYFGSSDGKFYALDTETGKKMWSYDLGAPVNSSPAVSGNAVYIASFDGTIYAFTGIVGK